MDPQVQTSFIPKQALTQQQARGGGMGLFFLLAILLFVMSLVAAGAALGYTQILRGQIADKDSALKKDEGAFDAASIQTLLRLDSRLIEAEKLMNAHVSPSAVFALLSQITLQRVQYQSFDYQLQPDGSASIVLSGIADSYSSVALQSDQFSATKTLREVVFSGITVSETGRVSFSVNASVDPSVLLYRNNLQPTL